MMVTVFWVLVGVVVGAGAALVGCWVWLIRTFKHWW